MTDSQLFLKILLSFLSIWINFKPFSSESICLCQSQNYEIKCDLDQYIVIKNARIGYLPYTERINYSCTMWCQKSSSYLNIESKGCTKSLRNIISSQCTGYEICNVTFELSEYLSQGELLCDLHDRGLYNISLYVDYNCVTTELFFAPDQMDNIHHFGGYITSLGYHFKKLGDKEAFTTLGAEYRKIGHPIQVEFKPRHYVEHSTNGSLLFLFEIIENTISLNITSMSDYCKRGQLFAQNYYAFKAIHKKEYGSWVDQFEICPTKPNMIGQIFGPLVVNQITIVLNVDFESFDRRVLLVKFTTIVCPQLVILNADVVYDYVVITHEQLIVTGVAIITCKWGFFFPSLSTVTDLVSSKTVECDDNNGTWNESNVQEACHEKLHIDSSIPQSQTSVAIITILTTNITLLVSPASSFMHNVLPVLIVLLLASMVLLVLMWKFWRKIKYSPLFSKWYSKPTSNQEVILQIDLTDSPKVSIKPFIGINSGFNENYAKTNSYLTVNMSKNLSPSDLTLVTGVGSNMDSIQGSSYRLDQMSDDDELPSKLPKSSTLTKIIRSVSTLRNSFNDRLRTKSLPRQYNIDQNSNISDVNFAKISSCRVSTLPQESVGKNSTVCTSDVYESNIDNEIGTDNTYLEPTNSSALPYGITVKSIGYERSNQSHPYSEYMIYDQSSNQSLISSFDDNAHANVPDHDLHNNHSKVQTTKDPIDSDTNETIYESIDDDITSLIPISFPVSSVRTNVPLPSPPSDRKIPKLSTTRLFYV